MAVYISGGIGDVVLHMGHIRALAAQAGMPLALLLPHSAATHCLFNSQPYIEQVIALDDIQKDRRHRVERLSELLRAQQIHTLFLFSFQRYVAQAARRARVPRRVGFVRYHQPHLAGLLTHRGWVKRRGTPHPDTHTWLPPILRRCGFDCTPVFPSLEVEAQAQAQARAILPEGGRLMGIGLNGSSADKRYGAEAFAEVIRQLHGKFPDVTFLLFGAHDVAELAGAVRKHLPNGLPVLDITDKGLSLSVSHALLAECQFFIGNDSMGLHVAVAHRIPSIGLFGATPPMRYVPWLHPVVTRLPGQMEGISPRAVVDVACRYFQPAGDAAEAAPETVAGSASSAPVGVEAYVSKARAFSKQTLLKVSACSTVLLDDIVQIGLEFNSYFLGG